MKIEIDLDDDRYKGLRAFADDWAHWHLDGHKMTDADALLVCVLHTAVGPANPNEGGASGAEPAEIDDRDLVQAVKRSRRARIAAKKAKRAAPVDGAKGGA